MQVKDRDRLIKIERLLQSMEEDGCKLAISKCYLSIGNHFKKFC